MAVKWTVITFKAESHPITFLLTKSFQKECQGVFSPDERAGFFNYLAANPAAGSVVPRASGIRKIRWKAKGMGKRGGARVIYYFRDLNMPLLLLRIYTKGDVARLSEKEMKHIESQMKEIVNWFAVTTQKRQSRSSA